ncbi:unnamed protein product [Clonostachys rosea]|uniref:EXPERA domain-containing protein n=1 Tax=Bionectria ochroleuca TaxID=29856 RepID=A0ABY6U0F2_BIOOC|nr:unnamed protein product [Clonostachys rosea]
MASAEAENGNDFALVSGFYGPGAIGLWYLLIASFAVTWAFEPEQTRLMRLPTPDFAAMVPYPIIAIGDLIIKILHFPPEHHDYLCDNLLEAVQYNQSSYEIDEPGEPGEELYPRIVALNVAMRIADIFQDLCILSLLIIMFGNPIRRLQTRNSNLWLHEEEADEIHWYRERRWQYLFLRFAGLPFWLIYGLPFGCYLEWKSSAISHYPRSLNAGIFQRMVFLSLHKLLCVFVPSTTIMLPIIMYTSGSSSYFLFPNNYHMPKTGYSIAELDQATALAGGAMTLILTVLKMWIEERHDSLHD